jgi:uncharacterized caspase-like protein
VAVTVPTGPAQAGVDGSKRLALVVGNSAYRNISALTNPVNDAADIAEKLKSLQFDVLLATDADHGRMTSVLLEFRNRVTPDHVALVFYAGHGVTVNKESFLLPVDTPGEIDADERGELRSATVNAQLVSMASVLAPLEAAKLGILFLDACRTNAASPGLGMSLRVASLGGSRKVSLMRGTGPTEISPSSYSAGVFRAYATQLDNVASDGAGRNSPFTKALPDISSRGDEEPAGTLGGSGTEGELLLCSGYELIVALGLSTGQAAGAETRCSSITSQLAA